MLKAGKILRELLVHSGSPKKLVSDVSGDLWPCCLEHIQSRQVLAKDGGSRNTVDVLTSKSKSVQVQNNAASLYLGH